MREIKFRAWDEIESKMWEPIVGKDGVLMASNQIGGYVSFPANQENGKNRPMQKNNTSGVVGVHRCKTHNRWVAYTKVDGKFINLGYFKDKFEAICARMSANNKYGFHANHGNKTGGF